MNFRATLVLLVITILAIGGLVFLRQSVPASRDRAEMERYALIYDPAEVEQIEIVRGNDTITLQRQPAGWRITSPVADRASPEAVDRLLSTARFLDVRDRVTRKKTALLGDAGLRTPRYRLTLRGEREYKLNVGSDTAFPEQVFARTGDSEAILRIPSTIVELLAAPADSFRDPRLTDLVADDIEKFTIRRTDGEMTLRRERNRWFIETPVRTEADPRVVRAFLEPLLGLIVSGFSPASTAPDTPAVLPGQQASLVLTTRTGSDMTLEVTRPPAAETALESVPARFLPRGEHLSVDPSALAIFEISPDHLRDRSLGYVDKDTVDRILFTTPNGELSLLRKGDGWLLREPNRPIAAAEVEAVIAAFNEMQVESFRPVVEPSTTNLDPAAESITFLAWLSENTAEDAAGGQVIGQIDLGASAGDNSIYARTQRTGEVVTINKKLLEAAHKITRPAETTNHEIRD